MGCNRLAIGVVIGALWCSGAVQTSAGEIGGPSGADGVRLAAHVEDASAPTAVMSPNAATQDGGAVKSGFEEEPHAPLPAEASEIEAAADAGPPAGGPWTIPQPVILQNHGIKMGGWLQQGFTWNPDSPADRFNGPLSTNDRANEYQMNQFWLYFARPTNNDGEGVDFGGRVDLVYGTDWRYGQCFGLENRFDSPDYFYGLVLPQFYGEVAIDDFTIKGGHFGTFTSYELVPAPANFFYSHSFLSQGYFDPMLVTGAQVDYKLNDRWTFVGGINNGWQMFEDPTDSWNFLGGVKWTSRDKRAALSFMVDAGSQIGFTGLHERDSCIITYTFRFNDRWSYASQYSFGREVGGSTVAPGENARWYGSDQYLFYKMNEKWTAGMRFECLRDQDGARIAGIGNLLGTSRGWLGTPGFTGTFSNLSLGLNWRPHPNFVVRPEARWDWYGGPTNPAGQLPYDAFTSASQYTFAMDMITVF